MRKTVKLSLIAHKWLYSLLLIVLSIAIWIGSIFLRSYLKVNDNNWIQRGTFGLPCGDVPADIFSCHSSNGCLIQGDDIYQKDAEGNQIKTGEIVRRSINIDASSRISIQRGQAITEYCLK